MVHVAIVEDEEVYIQQLKNYMEQFQKETEQEMKLSFFTDGDEIVEKYTADYDIILMDIQMQFMDGMTAAEKIRKMDQSVIIIFITNMTSYAVRGYEVDALDYMVKPIEYFSFAQKLIRAIDRIPKKESHFLLLSLENGMRKIDIEEIYYIESFGHQLVFVTRQGNFQTRGVMKKIEEDLSIYLFFRVGKSYLVNMKYVEGIQDGCCMINNVKLPISRLKRKEFMEVLTNYMSEELG